MIKYNTEILGNYFILILLKTKSEYFSLELKQTFKPGSKKIKTATARQYIKLKTRLLV